MNTEDGSCMAVNSMWEMAQERDQGRQSWEKLSNELSMIRGLKMSVSE